MGGYKVLAKVPSPAYSPKAVVNLFKKAIVQEGGDIEAVLKKSKHKKILELWYASVLATAVYKLTNDKFYMIQDENPDIHFLKNINGDDQGGFSVEILSLTGLDGKTPHEIGAWIWEKKGRTDYDRAELLLVSRIKGYINVDQLAHELTKFKWKFIRIYLIVYSSPEKLWHFFLMYPRRRSGHQVGVTVGLSEILY